MMRPNGESAVLLQQLAVEGDTAKPRIQGEDRPGRDQIPDDERVAEQKRWQIDEAFIVAAHHLVGASHDSRMDRRRSPVCAPLLGADVTDSPAALKGVRGSFRG